MPRHQTTAAAARGVAIAMRSDYKTSSQQVATNLGPPCDATQLARGHAGVDGERRHQRSCHLRPVALGVHTLLEVEDDLVDFVQSLVERVANDLASAEQRLLISVADVRAGVPARCDSVSREACSRGSHATWKPFCLVSPSTGDGSF